MKGPGRPLSLDEEVLPLGKRIRSKGDKGVEGRGVICFGHSESCPLVLHRASVRIYVANDGYVRKHGQTRFLRASFFNEARPAASFAEVEEDKEPGRNIFRGSS